MDQVEVACSHLTLLNVLRHENIATRFTHVAIGSGDHLFAEEAAHLAAQGVWVTVVTCQRSLSSPLDPPAAYRGFCRASCTTSAWPHQRVPAGRMEGRSRTVAESTTP